MHILKIIPGLPTKYDPCRMIWLLNHIYSLAENNKITVLILESLIHYLKPGYIKNWLKFGYPEFKSEHRNVTFMPVEYLGLPGYFCYKTFTFKRIEKAFKKVIKKIDLNKIDLIHAHFSSPAGTLARKLSMAIHKPYIVTEHAGNFDFLYETGIDVKEVIEDSSHLIYVSPQVRNSVKKKVTFLPDNDKYSIIPMGTDFSDFDIKEKEVSQTKKLLFIGWLVPNKGCDILIKALSLLLKNGEDCELSIIGDGGDLQNLKNLAERLEIGKKISFLGNIEHKKLKFFYQDCDVFILPSLQESFGVVIIEALACGKPVVATKSGGPETIINEKTGMLVYREDPHALAEGIKKVLENYKSYKPYEIRKYAEEKFSTLAVASKILSIYSKYKK